MNVIKRGTPPSERTYYGECSCCESELSRLGSEPETQDCPVCGEPVKMKHKTSKGERYMDRLRRDSMIPRCPRQPRRDEWPYSPLVEPIWRVPPRQLLPPVLASSPSPA